MGGAGQGYPNIDAIKSVSQEPRVIHSTRHQDSQHSPGPPPRYPRSCSALHSPPTPPSGATTLTSTARRHAQHRTTQAIIALAAQKCLAADLGCRAKPGAAAPTYKQKQAPEVDDRPRHRRSTGSPPSWCQATIPPHRATAVLQPGAATMASNKQT